MVTISGQPPVPDPLRDSLALHLASAGWVTWREIPLGPAPAPQADVVAMKKTYSARIVIYEVKVSRGDFLRDVGRGKYERYLPYCHQLYFAAPAGVLRAKDMPEGMGLITQGPTGWHTAIAARVMQMTPTVPYLLALLFRGYEEFRATRRLQERVDLSENVALSRRVKKLGWLISQRLEGGTPKEQDQLLEAKGDVERFLGHPVASISQGLYELESVLKVQVPGWRSMGMAVELVRLAHDLVRARDSDHHWAIERLQKLAQEAANLDGQVKEKL